MRYRVVLEQDEDGMYVAECPSLPGCVSQGNTSEETVTNETENSFSLQADEGEAPHDVQPLSRHGQTRET